MTDIIVQTADTISISNSGTVTQESGGDITQNYGATVNTTVNASSVAERTTDAAITAGVSSSVAPDTNWASDYVGFYCIVDAYSSNAELAEITAVGAISPVINATFDRSHATGKPVVLVNGFINAEWFGVIGDNSTDNTTRLQNAVEAAVALNMPLRLPHGQILFDTLDFSGVDVFANGTPFGVIVEGHASGTWLRHNDNTAGVAVDFSRTGDISFVLRDVSIVSNFASPVAVGVRIGENRATVRLENVHIYGFRKGILISGNVDGPLVLEQVQIRSCRRNGLQVDPSVTYVTHLALSNCLIENCGADSVADATQYWAVELSDCYNTVMTNTVIQGNFAGGLYGYGNMRHLTMYGCRVEETVPTFSTNFVMRLDSSLSDALYYFNGSHFAYQDGGASVNPHLFYTVASGHQITFDHCQIENTGTTTTSTMNFSASTSEAALFNYCKLVDCTYGNSNAMYINSSGNLEFRNGSGTTTVLAS